MEALFLFIAKSGGLLILFYCAYYFLLRKETFFNSNRWFLLTGLITSVVLPFLVYSKTVWVNPTPVTNLNYTTVYQPPLIENDASVINWNLVLLSVYVIVLLGLLLKFAFDFYSLNTVLKGKKITQQADFKFIDTNENIAPFSYFDYIVYNSSMYTPSELESIIEHEKVHSEQNHTVDVLLSRVFCVLFWFNPIMWLYKKAILQNLEFIADSEAARKISDKKAYQYTLLKITTHENCVAITNHFYQSLIKKRIIMLNKNQSKKRNSWKFGAIVPALAAFVLLFQIEVIAKEKQQTAKVISGKTESVDVYKIKKNTTDAELKDIREKLKSIHNIEFKDSEIKRNADNELISIKIDVKNGKQQAQSVQTSGNEAIKDFGLIVTTDTNGSKNVGIQTADENNNSESHKESKKVKSKKVILKQTKDVNTNSGTDTKITGNTHTNTSTTTVITDDNGTTSVSTTNNDGKIIISTSGKANTKEPKLIIVDGVEMPANYNLDDLKPKHIKKMSVYKGSEATSKYGEKGSNGVIEIETHQ